MPTQRFVVSDAQAGKRLDHALAELLPELSRSRIQEWIRDGGVRVAGTPCERPSRPVARGEAIELRDVPRSRERPGAAEGAELRVVLEDPHLVVVDKPAGMVVHPSSIVRGRTLSELAVRRWGPLPTVQGEDRPGIVHRLDAETSGLVVVARTDEAARELVRQFRAREVEKTYDALVYGEPRFDSDWIEAPLARAEKRGDRISIAAEGEGREASTFYETLGRFGDFAHLLARPKTGRTHQIRVHLASIDHPIVGDALYRGRRGLTLRLPPDAPPLTRHALHARGLRFRHPVTGAEVAVTRDMPADMAGFLAWARERAG